MAAERRRSLFGRSRTATSTVRVRMTAGTVVVVGIALLAGASALVVVLHDTLTESVRAVAELKADELVSAVEAASDPSTVDVSVADPEDQAIQLTDHSGRLISSSDNAAGHEPLGLVDPGGSEIDRPFGLAGRFLAVSVVTGSEGDGYTVLVAQSLQDVWDATRIVTDLLTVGLPLLLLVVAFVTWKVVGRALAPVEAIRREVDEISAAGLDRRVPEPVGRDEVSRLAVTMNRMLGRLEESHRQQQRFVSDASHELRSPVASIRQHAEVALAHPGTTSVAELAATVLAEDLRVQRLVDDLLLLARADEAQAAWRDESVDLDDLVLEEIRRLRETTTIRVDSSGVSAGRVLGDRGRLRRMLRNLTDNASRHARSRVALGLAEMDDGHLVLRIDDDGPGIRASDRERVFERFVRLDEGRATHDGGSGLGLAIVAEVAAAHGGTVTLVEAPGGGARFEVRLPILGD